MTTPPETPIYTIGYGARTIEDFIAVLQQNDIEFLADVRTAPYSRYKPEFSRAALEAELLRHGLRYIYMGDQLGGQPQDPDCYLDGKVHYDAVKQKPFYRRGIARLQKAVARGYRVVLMCSEGKPENCHRCKLIGESLTDLAIPLWHIDEKDELKSQDEVIQRITGGQLSLFGGYDFTSRKRYQAGENEKSDET